MNDEMPPDDGAIDAELAATDDILQRSLAQLLAPPADLETRTQDQVTNSLMSRSLLGTGADLLTVGWQTLRLMFADSEPGPDDHGSHEHETEVKR